MFFIGFALGDADRSDPQRTNLGYYLLPFSFFCAEGFPVNWIRPSARFLA